MPFYSFSTSLNLPQPYGEDCTVHVSVYARNPGARATRNNPGTGPEIEIEKIMVDDLSANMGKVVNTELLTDTQLGNLFDMAEEQYPGDDELFGNSDLEWDNDAA